MIYYPLIDKTYLIAPSFPVLDTAKQDVMCYSQTKYHTLRKIEMTQLC